MNLSIRPRYGMCDQRLQGKGSKHADAPHDLPKSPQPPLCQRGVRGDFQTGKTEGRGYFVEHCTVSIFI